MGAIAVFILFKLESNITSYKPAVQIILLLADMLRL